MHRPSTSHYDYDAVIIGSGIGGLTAGAYLAREGVKVLVCEQHNQPGGYFTSFKRKGYSFDGGIQACEDANLFVPMLRDLGLLEHIDLIKSKFALAMPDFFGPLTAISDLRFFYEHLAHIFPHERQALDHLKEESIRFCHLMDAIWQLPHPLFKSWQQALPEIPGWLLKSGPSLRHLPRFARLFNIPIDEYLAGHISDQHLINFLSQIGYRGCPASFSIPFIYFLMDYYYPSQGGVQAIPDLLARCIEENGGEIRYNALVENIMVENRKATGIRLNSAEAISAPFVINNGDARRTYLQMLPADMVPQAYQERLRQSRVSESAFMVFLGVDIPPEELPVQGCQHIIYMPDYTPKDYNEVYSDPEFFKHTLIMISIPSLHDKTLAPPGKSVLNLSIPASMKSYDSWGIRDGKRGQKYKAIKSNIADQLISNTEKLIPGLSRKIEVKFTATPYTLNRYTLNDAGTTAGWTYHPRETFSPGLKGMIGFRTPIKNMYQVGHWGFSPGGATSGFITGKIVSSLVRRKLDSIP